MADAQLHARRYDSAPANIPLGIGVRAAERRLSVSKIDCVADGIDRGMDCASSVSCSYVRLDAGKWKSVFQQKGKFPGIRALPRKGRSREVAEGSAIAMMMIERIELYSQAERKSDLDHRTGDVSFRLGGSVSRNVVGGTNTSFQADNQRLANA